MIGVTPGGPADGAGLKEGDVITAIDGKKVAAGDLPAVRQRLRDDAPGTVVTLSILRGGASSNLKVTLRDQI